MNIKFGSLWRHNITPAVRHFRVSDDNKYGGRFQNYVHIVKFLKSLCDFKDQIWQWVKRIDFLWLFRY